MLPEPESDLSWTAFLYISGDLSPEAATAFERRLADDQEAREAVAEAVELAGALALVGPEWALRLTPGKSSARRRALAVAASLAAACLVLALIPAFRSTRPAESNAPEVALAWSDLQGTADPDWLAFVAPSASESLDPVPAVKAEVEDEASTERALPSWLLTAASAPQGDAPAREEN